MQAPVRFGPSILAARRIDCGHECLPPWQLHAFGLHLGCATAALALRRRCHPTQASPSSVVMH